MDSSVIPHLATPIDRKHSQRAATFPPNADDVPTTIYFLPLKLSTLKLFLTLNWRIVPLSSVDVIRPYSFRKSDKPPSLNHTLKCYFSPLSKAKQYPGTS